MGSHPTLGKLDLHPTNRHNFCTFIESLKADTKFISLVQALSKLEILWSSITVTGSDIRNENIPKAKPKHSNNFGY